MPIVRCLRDVIIVLLITLTGLAIVEWTLGQMFPGDRLGRRTVPDRLVPGAESTFVKSAANGGERVVSRINRWGFRGPEIDRQTSMPRIMVYGDSNIQARFSSLEATFPYQLGILLEQKTGVTFDMINAGKIGFGPGEIAMRIDEDIDEWQPDILIVNLFADNDFGDLLRNNLFRFDADGEFYAVHERAAGWQRVHRFIEDSNLFRATVTARHVLVGPSDHARRQERRADESELAFLERRTEAEYRAYVQNRHIGGPDHYDLDVALNPHGESSVLKIRLMEQVLARIRKRVEKRSDTLLLFTIQPSSKDVSTNTDLNFEDLKSLSPDYHRSNLTAAMKDILDRIGAVSVNLFDTFKEDGKSPYFFLKDDNHWNDEGQRKAAEVVAAQLMTMMPHVTAQAQD